MEKKERIDVQHVCTTFEVWAILVLTAQENYFRKEFFYIILTALSSRKPLVTLLCFPIFITFGAYWYLCSQNHALTADILVGLRWNSGTGVQSCINKKERGRDRGEAVRPDWKCAWVPHRSSDITLKFWYSQHSVFLKSWYSCCHHSPVAISGSTVEILFVIVGSCYCLQVEEGCKWAVWRGSCSWTVFAGSCRS